MKAYIQMNNDVNKKSELQPVQTHEDFLPVVIGGEAVLVRSAEIKEVIRPVPLTAVPMGPNHLLGLANVRGQIICIIDLSKISSLPSIDRQATTRSRFIVLRHPRMHIGLWADEVRISQHIDSSEINCPDASAHDSNPVLEIDHQGQKHYLLNCMSLFH